MASQMHKRKSSQDDEENSIVPNEPSEALPKRKSAPDSRLLPPPPRSRYNSTPTLASSASEQPTRSSFNFPTHHPRTVSPFRTSFSIPNNTLSPPINGHGHSRTRTVSSPYSPTQSSPLAFDFPTSEKQAQLGPPDMATSISAPEAVSIDNANPRQHARRHSRMHSRNLSIFFPRPGTLPHNTIAEDGSQELHIGPDDEESALPIPSADSNISVPGRKRPLSTYSPITPLGAGFTFGAKPPRPPGSGNPIPPPMGAEDNSTSSTGSRPRRGHHHKHSLSHNFFSFLEPGTNQPSTVGEVLHTQPTPLPVSPWNPISPFPLSPPPSRSSSTQPQPQPQPHLNGHAHAHAKPQHLEKELTLEEEPPEVFGALGWAICQFALGGWMWVAGQQNGSLSVTGLGYWVVFHASGVMVGNVLPKRWRASSDKLRSSYGDGRTETVFMFAQSVYLMFAAVYICKETVEHVLLTAGSSGHGGGHETHHHHHADDTGHFGINFPLLSIFMSLVSIVISSVLYGTHSKLVEISGNRLPSVGRMIRSLLSSYHTIHSEPPPTTPLGFLLSNPYVLSPLLFCLGVLFTSLLVSSPSHIALDLTLAGIMTVVTFKLAYKASVILGTVLLQTAPMRGQGGRMEAFLRVMREIERHPNVVHVAPPHLWQLTPTPPNPSRHENSSLVATLELHVKKELSDEDVLALTKWASERCTGALGARGDRDDGFSGAKADVTVGVVRG
ncbi:hypothetical protein L218DRAFT_928783 [Marasmius fiardii PR-910]|nr:hypothetical protein L218DRAFT_928783 [Marasmius fiardii PR-910]